MASTTVLPTAYISQTVTALAAKCGDALDKSPLYLTKDEYIEAFIHPDHVEKLREVYTLLGESRMEPARSVINCNQSDSDERVPVHVVYLASVDVIVPKYAETTMNFGTPAANKIVEWAAERRRLGMILGDAVDALSSLNEICGNALAMAVAFPALGSLMTRSSTFKEQAMVDKDPVVRRGRTIGSGKSIGALPTLPREVTERLRTASALVQALILSEDASVERPPTGTAVRLSGVRWERGVAPPHLFRRPIMIQHNDQTHTSTYV